MGNTQKSIQLLEKAHQRDANDIETLRLLGIAYGVSNNGPKAIEYLEIYLQSIPLLHRPQCLIGN